MLKKRLSIFFLIFFILSSLLIIRISIIGSTPELLNTAKRQQTYKLNISNERANIYDRKMKKLTNTQKVWKIIACPDISVVDDILDMGSDLSREELADLVSLGKPFIAKVKSPNTQNNNIIPVCVTNRCSKDELAIHTLGYIDSDGEGVCGIEKAYNDFLKQNSHSVTASCTLDGKSKFLKGGAVNIEPHGNEDAGVILTIDSTIQDILERCCSFIKKGSAVVLSAENAQILAMASFPSFSTENLSEAINDKENAPMINRSLNAYPVGSVFKIVTSAAALDLGISPNTIYSCTGSIDISSQIFHCHNRNGHGTLNMASAFKESCNPYFIDLGQKLGSENLRHAAKSFGFGRKIQLADSFEASSGALPPSQMSIGELANFSFGQGNLTATPLQVAQMVFAIAGDGHSILPSLVIGTTTNGKDIVTKKEAAPIKSTSKAAAQQIRDFMIGAIKNTVAEPKFTTAGGKSSTAQTGRKNQDGLEEYETWFAGFFPADKPKYIAVITLENGRFGTLDCGPIFSRLADYLWTLDGPDLSNNNQKDK